MANQRDINSWGARQEPIQILQSRGDYKHIKRMVLELEGHDQEAASLQ